MQSQSDLLRACMALLLVIMASLVPHRLVQPEANAAPVTFRWDYTASGAAGFVLYCGPSSKNYPTRVDVGNTDTYTIGTLTEGATSFCAVTAYDPAKVESTFSNEVSLIVPAAAPVVNFSASPTSGSAPLNVAFTNASTGQVTTWAWDFGDGTASNVKSPTHVYSKPGKYTAVLTATGPGGTASKTAATVINVASVALPAVNFSASPSTGAAPLSVAFTNTTTGSVTTWAWNFGDGTTSNVQSPTHVYSTPGSYTVVLTATGTGGTASKTGTTISVSAAPTLPVVNFSASASSGTAPLSVAFTNTTTGPVTTWAWNFGDGTTSNLNSPTHVYSTPGSYSVTLTATGTGGTASKTAATAISVTTPSTPPATGLVAAYSFNEGTGTTVADASGNKNTGSITGATWTTQGRSGGALSFNGTSNLVLIPSSASLNVSAAMTLEAWIYPTASQSGWRTIMQREVDAYFLNASNDTGALRPSGGGTFRGTVAFVTGTTANPVNAWTHVALTYDGATLRLYVNGVLTASQARTGAVQTNSSPLRIGGNSPYGEYFQGRIDEVRVYNRALSQAEIQTDMNKPIAP